METQPDKAAGVKVGANNGAAEATIASKVVLCGAIAEDKLKVQALPKIPSFSPFVRFSNVSIFTPTWLERTLP